MSDGGSIPGWYPDPAHPEGMRWWDGRTWTSQAMLRPGAGSAQRYQEEARLKVWAQWLALAWAVIFIGFAIGNVAAGHAFHAIYEWYRQVVDNAGTPGYQAPPVPHIPAYLDFGVLAIGPTIVFAIWQYHAATTARLLGYPSSRSPGLGAGAWFIPVVGLWMPAQALMGCLPIDHPMRRRVPYLWALYVVAGGCTQVLAVVSAISESTAWVCFVPLAVLDVVLAVSFFVFVNRVDAVHRNQAGLHSFS